MEAGESLPVESKQKEKTEDLNVCIEKAANSIRHHCFKIEERYPTGFKKLTDNFKEMGGFAKIYGNEEVGEDIRRLAQIQIDFYDKANRENRDPYEEKVGDRLEAFVKQTAKRYEWFGKGADIVDTGLFDDWVNNTDAVLIFNGENNKDGKPQRLALVIDATSDAHVDSHVHKNSLIRKMTHNSLIVGSGERNRVKYFKSGDSMGQIECIPVVIGLDIEHVKKMDEKQKNFYAEYQRENYFRYHPAQMVFLAEINFQLKMYEDMLFSKQDQEKYSSLVGEIRNVKNVIGKIINEKKKDENIWRNEGKSVGEYLLNDKTYVAISEICKKEKK